MSITFAPARHRNEILGYLPSDELDRLTPYLTLVELRAGDVLISPSVQAEFAYFPESAIASVVALPTAERIEAVSVGREGFVGICVLLGGEPLSETIVQIAGTAHRIPAHRFQSLLPDMPVMTALLNRYLLTMIEEVSLTAACNRAHPLAERCAKWLLLVQDRNDENMFLLTHKFLATMLGVRRAGVTVAAGVLQKSGVIRYSRGKVTILDRTALEQATCACYSMIRKLQSARAAISGSSGRVKIA